MTDNDLALAVRLRCPDALVALRKRHEPVLHAVAKRYLHCEEEIKDVLSTVFLGFWTKPEVFDPSRGELLGLLITMTRRRSLDRVRAIQAAAKAADGLREQTLGSFTLPVRACSQLKLEVLRLPNAQRDAVQAFSLGLCQREAAKRLGIPQATYQTRLVSAIKKLRKSYANHC